METKINKYARISINDLNQLSSLYGLNFRVAKGVVTAFKVGSLEIKKYSLGTICQSLGIKYYGGV